MIPAKKWFVLIFSGLAILIAGLVIWQITQHDRGSAVITLGETPFGRTAAFLHDEQDTYIIWQPLERDTPLVVQPITTSVQVGILPYPDVDPVRWQSAPAEGTAFHVVWLENDGRLRSVLISATGETQRGPITLAFEVMRDFVMLPLADNRAVVLWRTPDDQQQVTAQVIDAGGRPGPTNTDVIPGLLGLTAALDRVGTLHLGWLSSLTPNTFSFYYGTTQPEVFSFDAAILLYTQNLASTQAITDLVLSLDETHAYLGWGVMTAEPTNIVDTAYVLSFPQADPAEAVLSDLRIPQSPTSCRKVDTASSNLHAMCRLATNDDPSTTLRALSAAPAQHELALFAAAIHTVDGWQPGLITFQHGAAIGYRLISARPADAGAPMVGWTAEGRIVAAWSGVDGVIPELYVVQLD